jgi:gas vesicle protein
MRRFFGFIIGALMGGIIGAAAALLFAPTSGEELRTLIDERSRNFTADIRQAANVKQIELRDRLESLRAPRP